MARIAFCWELGRGYGHILRHRDIIEHLTRRGDEVAFLARDPKRVRQALPGVPLTVIEIEAGYTAPSDRVRGADSFPEILHNCGFHDAENLHSRLLGITATLEALDPDVLITDFAPTVLLANIGLRKPLIAAGDGFTVPIRSTPMPRFRYWQGLPAQRLRDHEAHVLEVVNAVLERRGWRRLSTFAELLEADRDWLLTFAELDFYNGRDGARYRGTFTRAGTGMPPTWPDGSAPRVFAYLADGPAAPAILNALTECAGAVCLYAPELASDVRAALDPGRFDVADTLIDIAAAGREATLFVNNGNLNTATAALLAGRAQLNVPTTAEQYVNARRVELLGAGLAAPQAHPGDIPAKLNALLSDGRYRRAAARFASKYPDTSAQEQVRAMLGDVDALCGSPR